MPIVANGDNLPLQNAVAKYSAQSVFGTAVTVATHLGAVRAGYQKRSNPLRIDGPGSANIVAAKQGGTYYEWALQWAAVQTGIKTFLTKAVRVAGDVPLITLGIGNEDDTTPTSAKSLTQIRDCKINQLSLGFDAFGGVAPLTSNVSGFGTVASALTNQARGTLTSTPWVSAECVFQQDTGSGAAAYRVGSFNLEVNHNISLDYAGHGAAPTNKFAPISLTPHREVIRGSISRYVALGQNVHADTPPEFDLAIVFTNVDDAATLTLALTDCTWDHESEDHTDDGIRYSGDFEAKSWSLS